MIIFNQNKCIDICLKNKNKYVTLAVNDLQNDFLRVNKNGIKPKITHKENDYCIVIEENTLIDFDPIENESFKIITEENKIRIIADSYLGTMWGIYTFSEKILGIDPCYLFNDFEIEKLDYLEIDNISIKESPNGFKFRGAFINDEDLLTGWKNGGGPRYIDYRFYKTTVAENVMDMLVETALRLKMNLIIPATFLDIDNPPEKILADCVAKRGIYISQHHLEPLGVSHFALENYCKKFNKNGEYSYIKYPLLLGEVWNYYAKKWAEYENVVWQVGLRGKLDRPFWEEDTPTKNELQDYGKFISNAINTQCKIVKNQTNGKAKYFTSTLWMEGSALMEKGYLDINKNIINIFSDIGPNQMYGKEFHSVPRQKDFKYGIYYHLQYYDIGPHLAPQTGLPKLYYNIKKAYDNNDREYAIINVSNVREFTFELGAVAKLLWDTNGFENNEYLTEYCKNIYENNKNKAKILIEEYYNNLPTLEAKYLRNVYEKYFNYFYEEKCDGIKNFVLKEGLILNKGSEIIANFKNTSTDEFSKLIYFELKKVLPKFLELIEEFENLSKIVNDSAKLHTNVKWKLHSITLSSIYNWYINIFEAQNYWINNDIKNSNSKLQKACEILENYLEIRKCAEYGKFENWYREEIKFNIKSRLQCTKEILGQVTI